MAAIITEKFRMSNAAIFKDEFSGSNKYYMFLGKSAPWSANDAASATDSAPPAPADDVTSEMYYWDDMLAAKNIGPSDISFVVPRYNFETGVKFDRYEHNISSTNPSTSTSQTNLFNSKFYFVTSEFRAYKVLDNNNNADMSGTEPTDTSDGIFVHAASGFVLQYMFTISAADATKFLTVDFMPVSTSTALTANPADGAAQSLLVTGGGGYTPGTSYYTPIYGDGSGGIARIVVIGGVIQDFGNTPGVTTTISQAGTGYTYGTVNLSDPPGRVYTTEGAAQTDDGVSSLANTDGHLGGGSAGVITLNVSPKGNGTYGGHGYNPAEELGAHYVMLNTTFSSTDVVDVTQQNDFRRVGIVKSPTTYGTLTVGTASTYRTTQALYFDDDPSGTYLADEKITQSATGAVGKVVEWNSTKKVLFYTQERFGDYGTTAATGKWAAFTNGGPVVGAGGASGTPGSDTDLVDINTDSTDDITFTNGVATSELQPDSGDILYIENRKPITRVSDQTEDIKIIVEF